MERNSRLFVKGSLGICVLEKNMNSGYPAYPNPTITEAVCDIHFRLPLEKEWRPSFPGELFKHIQNEYPEMEPVLEMGLQFEFGPLGTGTKFVPQRQKVRFKHGTRPLILQLAEDSLSISTLSPYQGWETMRHDVLEAWQRVEEVLQPEVINRIGLRYIDRIVEREVPTGEVLMQEMDRLHADVWEVFSSAKGEKLEALLNRRPQ